MTPKNSTTTGQSKARKSPQPPMQVTGSRSLLGGLLSQPAPVAPEAPPKNKPGLPTGQEGSLIQEIEIKQIYRPEQPRRFFSPEEIAKLKASIQETGFQGAILVTPLADDSPAREDGYEYELIYGASRCLAMEQLGETEIPAIVRENLTEQEKHRIRLDENLNRANLNPLEELEGLLEVMADEMGVSPTEVEQDLHALNNATKRKLELTCDISRHLEGYQNVLDRYHKGTLSSFRSNLIKFRRLPADLLEVIATGQLDASKALELGSIKDEEARQELLQWVMDKQPTVKEIRQRKREQTITPQSQTQTQEEDLTARLRTVSKLPIWKAPTKEATRELRKIRAALDRLESLQQDLSAQNEEVR